MISEIYKNKNFNIPTFFTDKSLTDEDFVKDLYIKLKKPIFILSLSIVNDYHIAEDILQDTFVKAIENLDTFERGSNSKAWLLKISRNLSLNYLNKYKHEDVNDDITVKDNYSFTEEVESSMEFLRLIDPLDEDEKQVIALKLSAGLSHSSISKLMNISIVSSRKKYSRAIKKLKNINLK